MTFGGMPFGSVALPYPDEDHAAYPIQALAVLVALGLGLVRRRPYAFAVAASLLVTAALIAWQPWINRLILPTFVAGTPLVGWAADRFLARWRRAGPVLVAAVVLVAGARAGYTVWAGQPRPLGTANSVLTLPRRLAALRRDPWAAYEKSRRPLASVIDAMQGKKRRRSS